MSHGGPGGPDLPSKHFNRSGATFRSVPWSGPWSGPPASLGGRDGHLRVPLRRLRRLRGAPADGHGHGVGDVPVLRRRRQAGLFAAHDPSAPRAALHHARPRGAEQGLPRGGQPGAAAPAPAPAGGAAEPGGPRPAAAVTSATVTSATVTSAADSAGRERRDRALPPAHRTGTGVHA